MTRPNPIWISGEDTFGTSWSITDDASTAASISNISRNVSIAEHLLLQVELPFIVSERSTSAD